MSELRRKEASSTQFGRFVSTKQSSGRPGSDRPGYEEPGFERSVSERPGYERLGSDRPDSNDSSLRNDAAVVVSESMGTATDPSQKYEIGDAGSDWRMMKLRNVSKMADGERRDVHDVAQDIYGHLLLFEQAKQEQDELQRRRKDGQIRRRRVSTLEELSRTFRKHRDHEQSFISETSLQAKPQAKSETESQIEPQTESQIDSQIEPQVEPQTEQVKKQTRLKDTAHEKAHFTNCLKDIDASVTDRSMLNKLQARWLKAKMRGDPKAIEFERQFRAAEADFKGQERSSVDRIELLKMESSVRRENSKAGIGSSRKDSRNDSENDSRNDSRIDHENDSRNDHENAPNDNRYGRSGARETDHEQSLQELVRETKRQKVLGVSDRDEYARAILRDKGFRNDDDDYTDDNAERLATKGAASNRSIADLRTMTVAEYKQRERVLATCPLCLNEAHSPVAPVVSAGTRVYLTLPSSALVPFHCLIVPTEHHVNTLECDDDEWTEIRNFKKCLVRMAASLGQAVIFYENASHRAAQMHAAIECVPVPQAVAADAPAFFREALLETSDEWSQHRKIIDTRKRAERDGMGKGAFRASLVKELPYFHVWFTIDGGIGHVVENEERFGRGDTFARQVFSAMLGLGPEQKFRRGRWGPHSHDEIERKFKQRWDPFDWTVQLNGTN